MNVLAKAAPGLCYAALGLNQSLAADSTDIDMTCDSQKPVMMLVAGRTLDATRMRGPRPKAESSRTVDAQLKVNALD